MENARKRCAHWLSRTIDDDLRREIEDIINDDDEIYDRFCKELTFGTAGLRGKMGAGSNRINSLTIGKATAGIGTYLRKAFEKPKIIIGYDTRNNSRRFANLAAEGYAKQGVEVLLFDAPVHVPVLSFAIRRLGLSAGVMITASHNPREYNGYKVYDHRGNQLSPADAKKLQGYISEVDEFCIEEFGKNGRVEVLSDEVRTAYLEVLRLRTPWWDEDEAACKEALSQLKVCYTPLHGAGYGFVMDMLNDLGVRDVARVESQLEPDGNFPTCPSPNPEYAKTFDEALKTCEQYERERWELCDVILATDPDSDRLGVMCLDGRDYVLLTGNEVGEVLLDYICRVHARGVGGRSLEGSAPGEGKIFFKSHVSSHMAELIAKDYGLRVVNVFSGFKNIAEELEKLEQAGRSDDFLFAFEESLGYLYGDYTRDKDAVLAAQLVCLAAAELKAQDKTLLTRLRELYDKHGHMEAITFSNSFKGERGREMVDAMMQKLYAKGIGALEDIGNAPFSVVAEEAFPQQKMYRAELADGHAVIIRPSGTEPKVKTYIFAKGETLEEAINNSRTIMNWVKTLLDAEVGE